jgi:hypothetical protein
MLDDSRAAKPFQTFCLAAGACGDDNRYDVLCNDVLGEDVFAEPWEILGRPATTDRHKHPCGFLSFLRLQLYIYSADFERASEKHSLLLIGNVCDPSFMSRSQDIHSSISRRVKLSIGHR